MRCPKAIYLLSAIVFGMPTNQQASRVSKSMSKATAKLVVVLVVV